MSVAVVAAVVCAVLVVAAWRVGCRAAVRAQREITIDASPIRPLTARDAARSGHADRWGSWEDEMAR